VAAIAERLAGAFAAGAPEVALAGFHCGGVGSFLGNRWFRHRGISSNCSRHIIADPGGSWFDFRKTTGHRFKIDSNLASTQGVFY
jgi:hypothetical protein